MKTKHSIAALLSWLALSAGVTPLVQGADSAVENTAMSSTGTIVGRVSNAGTNVYLDGAQVTLQPSGRTAITEREGGFTFTGVPPGEYQLTVSYTGLQPGSETVVVSGGTVVTRNFNLTSDVYTMGQLVVSGDREGTSRAIQLQRYAPNVKNILSSDAFGNIADDNIGNFMRRLPGVVVGESEGGATSVEIRGISADLNAITIDGTRGASGRTTGAAASGETRAFELDTISAESIETVEVTKAPTPDMDADSVGGAVNLVTKSAFDRRGRSMTYRIASTYNVVHEQFRPSMTFSYSDVIGSKRNLGIMITGNFNRSVKSRDNYRVEHESTTETDRTAFWLVGQVNEDALMYSRMGGSIRFDYKLSENSTLFFKGLYNYVENTLRRNRSLIQPNPTTIPLQVFTHYDAAGVARTATNAVARVFPGWTDKVVETINNNFTADQNYRDAWVRTLVLHGGGERRFSGARLDYDVSYSWSDGTNDRVSMGTQVQNVGFRFEKKPGTWGGFATYDQINGPDIFNWANRRISSYNLQQDTKEDEIIGAQINFRKDFNLPVPTYLKTGLRARMQNREHDLERPTYAFVGTGSIQRFQDMDNTYRPFEGTFTNAGFLDPDLMAAEFANSPGSFSENIVATTRNSLNNDFTAEENVYAAYILGSVKIGRLGILSGVRVEQTEVSGTGNIQEITPEEAARRRAWVGTVTPDEQRRRILAEAGNSKTNEADYRNVFPSVHFRYDVTSRMVGRASYSTGIGRPGFGNLVPRENVNHEMQTVSGNNPGLKPQFVDNFDLSLEYYYEPAGMISVGAFAKEFSDFIFRADGITIPEGPNNGFDGEYAGYQLSTWANGGSARVRGIELSYQQQFSFLPGFWRGFGVFGNFTWLRAEGEFGEAGVPGFAPQSGTAGITYADYGWAFRLIGTYTSENPGGFSADPSQQSINKARWNVDLNASYKLNRWLSVFCDVRNLTDEHSQNNYKFIPSRQFQYQQFSTEITFGVNGRF